MKSGVQGGTAYTVQEDAMAQEKADQVKAERCTLMDGGNTAYTGGCRLDKGHNDECRPVIDADNLHETLRC